MHIFLHFLHRIVFVFNSFFMTNQGFKINFSQVAKYFFVGMKKYENKLLTIIYVTSDL